MADLVTWKVPFPDPDSGYRMIHPESSLVPDVGEAVSAATEPDGELGDFVVASREWRLVEEGHRDRDETKVQAIVYLKPIEEADDA